MNPLSKVLIPSSAWSRQRWTSELTFFQTTSPPEIIVILLAHLCDFFNKNTSLSICKFSAAQLTLRGELNSRISNAFCEIKEFLAEGSEGRVGNCPHWTPFKSCLICSCELCRRGHLLAATKAAQHQCSLANYSHFSRQYRLFHEKYKWMFSVFVGFPRPHGHGGFLLATKGELGRHFSF